MRVAGKLMGSVTRDSWARLAHSACGGGHRSPGNGLASVITTRSLGRAAMGCTHAGCPGSGGTEGREEKVGGIPDYFGGVPREWCMRSSKDSLQIGSKYQGLSWEGSISPGRLTRFWWRWDRRGALGRLAHPQGPWILDEGEWSEPGDDKGGEGACRVRDSQGPM